MKHRKSEDALFLVGGALLGAAAMYLMDPETGERRRRRLASAAESAYEDARDTVGEHLHNVSGQMKNFADRLSGSAGEAQQTAADYTQSLADQARSIASGLTGKAASYLHGGMGRSQDAYESAREASSDYAGGVRDVGSRLWNRARNLGSSLVGQAHDVQDDVSDRAQDWGDWLSKRASKAKSQTRSWLGQKETGVGAGMVASTALTCCAVGAGMMYFLDPARGRMRRDRIASQTAKFVKSTGRMMRATGEDLAHRLRGAANMARGTSGHATMDKVNSEQLTADIRAAVRNSIPDSGEIQFMCDADGTVTITGNIDKDQVDALLWKVHGVWGVSHVINRLNVRDKAGASRNMSNDVVPQI